VKQEKEQQAEEPKNKTLFRYIVGETKFSSPQEEARIRLLARVTQDPLN